VPGHAYAVLDVKEAGRLRMLKVKNPWSHRPWRGKFSNVDRSSWTSGLKSVLGVTSDSDFDVMEGQGVFWIEFSDCRKFFKRLYLNWNPALFHHSACIHDGWPAAIGPKNDKYYVGDNPQYSLNIDFSKAGKDTSMVTIWVLLTRHCQSSVQAKSIRRISSADGGSSDTDTSDIQDEIFLTCHIYRDGKRIYSPGVAFLDGVYTNDPHTLIRFDIDAQKLNSADKIDRYTLVLSQLAKAIDITYTVNVYSTVSLALSLAPSFSNVFTQDIKGAWSDETSGGCSEFFNINPQYRLVLQDEQTDVHIQLFYPPTIRGNISIVLDSGMTETPFGPVPTRTDNLTQDCQVSTSGPYKMGFTHCSCSLPAGSYNVILSNFYVSMKSPYRGMFATSSKNVSWNEIPPQDAGLYSVKVDASWSMAAGTAVGCCNFGNYMQNPKFRIDFPRPGRYCIGLRLRAQVGKSASTNISVYKFSSSGAVEGTSPKQALLTSFNGVYSNFQCGATVPLTWLPEVDSSGLSLVVIVSTFDPLEAGFTIEIFSNIEDITSRVIRIQ